MEGWRRIVRNKPNCFTSSLAWDKKGDDLMKKYTPTIFLIIVSVLWISNSIIASNIVNFKPNLVLTTISVGKEPGILCVNPKTNMIYVTNYDSNDISVINGKTNSVSATISVGKKPIAIAVNPNTNMIYAANFGSNNITVIDGRTNSTIATIAIKTPKFYPEIVFHPDNIAVDTKTNMIYVTTADGDLVYVIDGITNKIVSVIIISNDSSGEVGLDVNQITGRIYVSSVNYDTVSVLKAVNRMKKHKAFLYSSLIDTLPVGNAPYSLAVNPNTNMIYVANYKSGTVTVINGSNDSVLKKITVGKWPIDICVNLKTNMIYVANGGNNTVSVINGKSNSVVAMIPVGDIPDGICVNPNTNTVYVSNQDDGTVSVIKGLK